MAVSVKHLPVGHVSASVPALYHGAVVPDQEQNRDQEQLGGQIHKRQDGRIKYLQKSSRKKGRQGVSHRTHAAGHAEVYRFFLRLDALVECIYRRLHHGLYCDKDDHACAYRIAAQWQKTDGDRDQCHRDIDHSDSPAPWDVVTAEKCSRHRLEERGKQIGNPEDQTDSAARKSPAQQKSRGKGDHQAEDGPVENVYNSIGQSCTIDIPVIAFVIHPNNKPS